MSVSENVAIPQDTRFSIAALRENADGILLFMLVQLPPRCAGAQQHAADFHRHHARIDQLLTQLESSGADTEKIKRNLSSFILADRRICEAGRAWLLSEFGLGDRVGFEVVRAGKNWG